MRIVVMSDIHGFSLALDAVAGAIAALGPVDAVVVAGDLCEVGPDPAGVIDRLRTHPDWIVLKGNTDDDLVRASDDGENHWTLGQIGHDGVACLRSLPFQHQSRPPGRPSDDDSLLVVHANPHDLRDRLPPDASDDEVRETIGGSRFGALAFGHVHIAYQRTLDGRLLTDVSAVGNPKDGDLRCAFGSFTWDEQTGRWESAIHRIAYPVEATMGQIGLSGMPGAERVAERLLRASY